MKLRKRNDTQNKIDKKDKSNVEPKKDKDSITVKKKKKVRSERSSKKSKAANKKAAETLEVIEIPPVVHCAIDDVVSALKEATNEELELKEECSLIFECNQCESFYRSIGSYLCHKVTFCSQKSSENFEDDLIHKVYSWPYPDNFKEETKKKEFDPLLLVSGHQNI
ncbi:uncharacterized protein [Halyomorpha halys]|uniref:uncharacterized protein n=1 Tax=Halyomorpha halys TaxID=286706 RepID=UPI0006D4CCD4|nr:uncharacterized protein LOC106685346 [Halyomorpha halys]XP_024218526.1 uncharacterized protein LOC106685346 [Halyomorpha halys]